MRHLIILSAAVMFSCSNNTSADAETTQQKSSTATVPTNDQNIISFKVNGEQVQTTGWNIGRFGMGTDKVWLNIVTDRAREKRVLNVNLSGTDAGTYAFEEGGAISGKSHGSYHLDITDAINAYSITSGSFIVTEVDIVKNVMNATFSATVQNTKGETLQITEGRVINGTLKSGVTRL